MGGGLKYPSPLRGEGRVRGGCLPLTKEEHAMARGGYRIFDADTHIIEPVEPIEEYLAAADRAKLAALGPLIGRAPAKAGMSRYRIGKRPALNRRLGSRERVAPPSAAARGAKDGGTTLGRTLELHPAQGQQHARQTVRDLPRLRA